MARTRNNRIRNNAITSDFTFEGVKKALIKFNDKVTLELNYEDATSTVSIKCYDIIGNTVKSGSVVLTDESEV